MIFIKKQLKEAKKTNFKNNQINFESFQKKYSKVLTPKYKKIIMKMDKLYTKFYKENI